jgi:SAM-dependent methyltransferase
MYRAAWRFRTYCDGREARRNGRLLDLGCGTGPVVIRLAHLFNHVVAMDPEPQAWPAISRKTGCSKQPSTRCPSSKPDPHEFIGSFERMAIAYFHGDRDKRSSPGRRERTFRLEPSSKL